MDRKYRYIPPIECKEVFNENDYVHMFESEIDTKVGPVKILKTNLSAKDKLGSAMVRLGIKRKNYKFPPGLYAIGSPDESSPILVTSNYKLTIDSLRVHLSGIDAWLLALNTDGINVWCAAGKGSFGSDEIIYRIKTAGLYKLSKSKLLIMPQLGAPGVNPVKIRKYTKFKTVYGPVRAKDIGQFFRNGFNTSGNMRRVSFSFRERIILSPVEVVMYSKHILSFAAIFLLLNYINNSHLALDAFLNNVAMNSAAYACAIMTACVAFPALLPVLPFRSFSAKGAVLGAAYSAFVLNFRDFFMLGESTICTAGHFLVMSSTIGFIGLNFTGSTNFTSLSGVQKETLWGACVFAACFAIGLIFLFFGRLV